MGQSIVIGGNIVVRIVRVEGHQIKLGIQAPPEIQVHREEIRRQKDAGMKPRSSASGLKAALGLPA